MKSPRFIPAIAALAAALSPSLIRAGQTVPPPPPLLLGSAWYPEDNPGQMEADLAMMQQCGLRVARVGEFAWDKMEPEEGHFTLEWLDRVIAAAAAHGVYIIIGTPTDGPPSWMPRKYPDIVRWDVTGRPMSSGGGRSFSYASRRYRDFCRQIAGELAQRYGHNPDVIGWQIGNEPTEDSFDPQALSDFHDWLRSKYGTLEAFNAHQRRKYLSWDAVKPPGTRGASASLYLDYKRFVSSEWESYHQNQTDVIHRYADRRQFVTTNFGGLGWAVRFNRHEVAKALDLAAWDNYVGIEHFDAVQNTSHYSSLDHFDPARNGATHDLARGWKQRNFWLLELQPAFVDWAPVSNAVDRGVVRDMVWQAIGHGADGISFWQWKAGGVGPYHGSLVGADVQPRPVFAEVKQAAREMAAAAPAFAGTTPHSDVAILHDYDSRWAIDYHRQTERYDQVDILIGYYRALRGRAQSVDIVDPSCDLSQYKVIAAPSLNVISAELGERLESYVRGGGHLLLGPRSGMVDEFNTLNPHRPPGPLVGALGGRSEEYYALVDDVPVEGKWGRGTATIWAELLSTKSPETKVELTYGPGNGWLEGQPAALERKLGQGTIEYLGAVLDRPLMQGIADRLCDEAGVPPAPIVAPEEVEVCRRVGADHEVFVLINHGVGPAVVQLPGPMTDLIRSTKVRRVDLPPKGVAVLSHAMP